MIFAPPTLPPAGRGPLSSRLTTAPWPRGRECRGDIAVVNIGGVANVTRIGRDGSLIAGDTGPGNALLDDFMQIRTGAAMIETVNRPGVAGWTKRRSPCCSPTPGSISRSPSHSTATRSPFDPVAGLTTEDGAATLTAFTARSIAKGIALAGGAERIVIAGGGSHNPQLLSMIAAATASRPVTADELGWSADFIEAEAFAFLAVRSLAGLPLSYPETTGVPRPMPGGAVARP